MVDVFDVYDLEEIEREHFDHACYGVAFDQYAVARRMVSRGMWKMKDGKEIQVCDMSDSHIENTINMIRRKGDKNLADVFCPMFEKELKIRKGR